MSDDRPTNRKSWIAIGLIVLFAAASFILKAVVDEVTKPAYDIPTVYRNHPEWNHWTTEE
jgi:hypothetical protein